MSTSYCGSDVAKGKPLAMQGLNHATFLQRKMAAGCTYVLNCVRMDVIHSDCSFVDDFSQNHFNMKLHYGFLFFDYLFKFILQLTLYNERYGVIRLYKNRFMKFNTMPAILSERGITL